MAVVKLTEEQKKLIDNFVKEGKLILKSEKPCTHKGSNATSKIFEFRDKECQKEYSMSLIRDGEIPVIHIGQRMAIPRQAVLDWVSKGVNNGRNYSTDDIYSVNSDGYRRRMDVKTH